MSTTIFTKAEFMIEVNKFIRDRDPNDIIITQFMTTHNMNKKGQLSYLDRSDLLIQLKYWRDNKCFSRNSNIREKITSSGELFWLFVIQFEDEAELGQYTGVPLATFLCEMLVSGLPYITFDKTIIDLVQRVIGK